MGGCKKKKENRVESYFPFWLYTFANHGRPVAGITRDTHRAVKAGKRREGRKGGRGRKWKGEERKKGRED